ncbi:hypothetical protein EES43_24240 [Streptomyces sp. ADI96-02]|uniref:hypothetical protein n=1 Tax=Streptomyces sp. ADI96-02 TaxID=1522760 RepID=UPI000F5531FD|nr:hypothetical protein [Streptomyces sp. ADI96-02]RPK56154.1 hypothetical protein EES43_24240 [Streptomyces sp. ADI96-02]
MTEKPYTNEDLRAEATRQHAALTKDPDFMGVGEQMEGRDVVPDGGVAWNDFSDETHEAAQRSIHGLISGAADVSKWAVNLGADGLEPVGLILNINDSVGEHRVRLHFAFAPDMDKATRNKVIDLVADAIRRT